MFWSHVKRLFEKGRMRSERLLEPFYKSSKHRFSRGRYTVSEVSKSVKENFSNSLLNQFLVQSALTAANQILETERTIFLSERDAQTVFDLLENPPTPSQQLLVAVDRHRAFIRENNRTAE
jgi:hypothetical protein